MKTIALICTHNGERYLEEQINSILNQTKKIDLIIIDDYNSSDSTIEIIKEKVRDNADIVLNSYKSAKGPAHSFLNSMKAIRELDKNDYLLYLVDQDDVWLPHKNENVMAEFIDQNVAILFHDVQVVDEQLSVIRKSYYENYWNVARDLKFPNQLYSNCVIGHTCALTSGFLNTVSLEYDVRIPMHDWYLLNEALFQDKKIVYIEETLSLYRQHNNNILGAARNKNNSVIKSLITHSARVKMYHSYLGEKHPKQIKKYKLNCPFTILGNVRPMKKMITILIIKYAIYYDKIRLYRAK